MRRIADALLCAIALVVGLLASAQQTQTVSQSCAASSTA